MENNSSLRIRRGNFGDKANLLELWRQSAHATHHFLSDQELEALTPHVQEYLANVHTEFWVCCDCDDKPIGFMGLLGNKMESLFVAPKYFRCGVGRKMIQHASGMAQYLTVDVNEPNHAAIAFYKACGFHPVGRTEYDEQGNPYPLIHMRRDAY